MAGMKQLRPGVIHHKTPECLRKETPLLEKFDFLPPIFMCRDDLFLCFIFLIKSVDLRGIYLRLYTHEKQGHSPVKEIHQYKGYT